MQAILLAAGRGRRLESDLPKCLLEIAGRTLLERHLDALATCGVRHVTIVVGYRQEDVRAHVADRAAQARCAVELVENPDFARGSIVSLALASAGLTRAGGLFMDADVLYPPTLLQKLVRSSHENCVLLDPRSSETGEEMMLGVRGGRVLAIARKVTPLGAWDEIGESVGFAKVGAEGAKVLDRILQAEVGAGRLDQEYEAAMNLAFGESPWGFERVDAPWTEIDFQGDLTRARELASEIDGAQPGSADR